MLADAGSDQAIHDEDEYSGSPGLERRWYDDALVLTWRRGALWGGVGSDVAPSQLWDHGQGQRCVFHMMGSKRQPRWSKRAPALGDGSTPSDRAASLEAPG